MSLDVPSLQVAHDYINGLRDEISQLSTKHDTVIDALVDALVIMDEHNLITTFNPAAAKMFGYTAEEAIGQNVSILTPDSTRDEHDKYIERYHRTEQKHIIGKTREVRAQRKDGSTFPILLSVNEMWINNRRQYTGLIKDITKQKQMEEVKNEFISTVSHELRTPLTSIRGALGLMTGGATGDLTAQQKSLLTIAESNTERLLLLINDILDIEKMEAGQLRFNFKRCDLVPLIEQCIIDDSCMASALGISFNFTNKTKHTFINGDSDRLFQVINNLLSNAAKFSEPGGVVDVELIEQNGLARISVIDHGMGIPSSFMPMLFKKFSQADSTDVKAKPGTGLGLSITKAIIEKHHGRISVESEYGHGAAFHVDLPLASSSTFASKVTDQIGSFADILIVEDDPDIAQLIKRMLNDANCQCDIAYDSIQARKMLNEKKYDAMTLDLILPGQSGMEFLAELEGLGEQFNIPVVVISVDADNQKDSSAENYSVVEWIQKPIDGNKLIAAVTMNHGSKGKKPVILQVEDEQDVQNIVGLILADHAEIVTASSLQEAREKLAEVKFDLVLLDIGLPDGSGLELLPDLQNQTPPVQAVIFSAQDIGHDVAEHVSAALVKSRTSNLKLIQTIKAVIK